MTKKEQILEVLRSMGYKPQIDPDGYILLCYQLKKILFLTSENEDEQFINMCMPKLYDIKKGEELLDLTACNKITRDVKLTKIFINRAFNSIGASCEFYYNNEESLRMNISKSIDALSVIRTIYRNFREELASE